MRKLVSWGHHLDEYRDMFALSEDDLKTCRFLEYGASIGAVNAEAHERGVSLMTCDPLFMLEKSHLLFHVSSTFEEMVTGMAAEKAQFDFRYYGDFEALIATRRLGMATFFKDYEKGEILRRYLPVQDGLLPFSDFSFDFVLSAYRLFADANATTVEYHLRTIRALARVAKEVRLFPLVDSDGQTSPLLGPVLLGLQQEQYGIEVREVAYQLQPKANAMLRVWAERCELT